jgi:nitrite reductase/ring-hydroxylating ferredoxin subunit
LIQMATPRKLCDVQDVPLGEKKFFKLGDVELVVINQGGKFYALQNWCTHEAGKLSEGELHGHTLKCPDHGAEFDIASGRVMLGPDGDDPSTIEPLRRFEVKAQGNELYILA